MSRLFIVATLFAVVMLGLVQADLPVHCLGNQIEGRWMFTLVPLPSIKSSPYNPDQLVKSCTASSIRQAMSDSRDITLMMTIRPPNEAVIERVHAVSDKLLEFAPQSSRDPSKFTMMYDQGFDMTTHDGWSFFAFSKYAQLKNKHIRSMCNETSIGLYHNKELNRWGCFVGFKRTTRPGDVIDHAPINDLLANYATNNVHLQPGEKSLVDSDEDQIRFEPNLERIDHINSQQSSWRATHYPHFEKLTVNELKIRHGTPIRAHSMNQLESFSGRAKAVDSDDDSLPFHGGDLLPRPRTQQRRAKPLPENKYPKSWDWRNVDGQNYLSPVRDQGACGSCFVWASLDALEARLRIRTKNQRKLDLSVQDMISCSPYAQKCRGGFPYAVAKHAHDFGLVTADCFPYTASNSSCSLKCKQPKTSVRVSQYGYIGGFYGAASELEMMDELMNNGPIVSSFLVQDDFKYYKDGIYHHVAGYSGHANTARNIWEPTSHSICIFGWGEDEKTGERFWLAKNSWGDEWGSREEKGSPYWKEYCASKGENAYCGGFFKIRRGVDESNVESQPVSFRVSIDDAPKVDTGNQLSEDWIRT